MQARCGCLGSPQFGHTDREGLERSDIHDARLLSLFDLDIFRLGFAIGFKLLKFYLRKAINFSQRGSTGFSAQVHFS